MHYLSFPVSPCWTTLRRRGSPARTATPSPPGRWWPWPRCPWSCPTRWTSPAARWTTSPTPTSTWTAPWEASTPSRWSRGTWTEVSQGFLKIFLDTIDKCWIFSPCEDRVGAWLQKCPDHRRSEDFDHDQVSTTKYLHRYICIYLHIRDETNNNFGPNTNTNNIRFSKMDEYEYEYYSFFKNGRIQIRIVSIWILFE